MNDLEAIIKKKYDRYGIVKCQIVSANSGKNGDWYKDMIGKQILVLMHKAKMKEVMLISMPHLTIKVSDLKILKRYSNNPYKIIRIKNGVTYFDSK